MPPATLCFVDGGEWLQGRMIDVIDKTQIGFFGEVTETPKDKQVHECCFNPFEPPCFYRITVLDFASGEEYVSEHEARERFALIQQIIDAVEKTGGDNAQLKCDELEFSTTEILVDKEARDYVHRYFPKIKDKSPVTVCIGEMRLLHGKASASACTGDHGDHGHHKSQDQPPHSPVTRKRPAPKAKAAPKQSKAEDAVKQPCWTSDEEQ